MANSATARLAQLFVARVIDNASVNRNCKRFCLSLKTYNLEGKDLGELPITPGFDTPDDLEVFCRDHWHSFMSLDHEMRELGAVPTLFWQKASV